jgi:hypothetical protein
MKVSATLVALLAFASTGFAAEPPKVKEPPAVKRACLNCSTCGINCPCPGAGVLCADGKCPSAAQPAGTLRTTSGALIRPNGKGGYEYVSEGAPASTAPVYSLPQSFGASPCANGQCGVPQTTFRRR